MKFLAQATPENARLLFRRSLLHLPIVMTAAVVFRLPQETSRQERRAWGDTLEKSATGVPYAAYDARASARESSTLRWDVQTAPFPFLPPPTFQRHKETHADDRASTSTPAEEMSKEVAER